MAGRADKGRSYVCAKLSEQVSFAAAMTGKGGKPQKSSAGAPVTCTVCKKNKTTNSSKVCLACAQAKKAAGAPAAAVATGDDGRERQCQCPRPQHPGFAGIAGVSKEGGERFWRERHGTLQQRTPPAQVLHVQSNSCTSSVPAVSGSSPFGHDIELHAGSSQPFSHAQPASMSASQPLYGVESKKLV